MSDFINTIDVLGDEAVAVSIIDKTITELKDNQITSVGTYAFYKCTSLKTVELPSITSVGKSAFYGCTQLESIDLKSVTNLPSEAFYSCSSLKTLILRSETMCTMQSGTAINNTPIAYNGDNGAYIYVPSALYDSYRSGTNWSSSSVKRHFRKLEDYTVDGTIYGELDPTKI